MRSNANTVFPNWKIDQVNLFRLQYHIGKIEKRKPSKTDVTFHGGARTLYTHGMVS